MLVLIFPKRMFQVRRFKDVEREKTQRDMRTMKERNENRGQLLKTNTVYLVTKTRKKEGKRLFTQNRQQTNNP